MKTKQTMTVTLHIIAIAFKISYVQYETETEAAVTS